MSMTCADIRKFLLPAAVAAVVAACMPARAADPYPSRVITLIVPFSPGGTTDIIARILAEKFGASLKQTVLIDNRPGSGGNLGAALAAKAAPDGYTLFMATVSQTIAPGLYKSLPYSFTKDLDPVALVALTPNVLLVNPSDAGEQQSASCRLHQGPPRKVSYGSAGIGSTEHLSRRDVSLDDRRPDIVHIPYKGGAPMMADLMGGQIQMAIETSPSAAPQVKAGKVQALAVTSAKRSTAYPTCRRSTRPASRATT